MALFLFQLITLIACVRLGSSAVVDRHATAATSFSVKQVAVGRKVRVPSVVAMHAYNKFAPHGAVAPEFLASAAAAAKHNGSVSAKPDSGDDSYLSPVNVGGQKLILDFDTGSSDLWVFSALTPKGEVNGQTRWNPTKSKSAKRLDGYTWEISYGDGSGASGVVYTDTVRVGGVTATSQAVEAATQVSGSFSMSSDTDGLLGLAFSSINTVEPEAQKTFFGTVASRLKSRLFTADLKHRAAGTYDFGYIDASKYTGNITYVPVNAARGFWEIDAGSIAIGDNVSSRRGLPMQIRAEGSIGKAIVDTGTTLLYLPESLVSTYYSAVKGARMNQQAGGWVFPCSSSLPSLGISIGDGFFVVPSQYLNYGPMIQGGKVCFGGVQPKTGLPFSILGDTFLKAQFVVFDQTQSSPRVGFASKNV